MKTPIKPPKQVIEELRRMRGEITKENAWLASHARKFAAAELEFETARKAMSAEPSDKSVARYIESVNAMQHALPWLFVCDQVGDSVVNARERMRKPLLRVLAEIRSQLRSELDAQVAIEREAAERTGIEAEKLRSPRRTVLERLLSAVPGDEFCAGMIEEIVLDLLGELDADFVPSEPPQKLPSVFQRGGLTYSPETNIPLVAPDGRVLLLDKTKAAH